MPDLFSRAVKLGRSEMHQSLSVCKYVPEVEIHIGNSVAKCYKNEYLLKIIWQGQIIKKLILI